MSEGKQKRKRNSLDGLDGVEISESTSVSRGQANQLGDEYGVRTTQVLMRAEICHPFS